MNHQAILNKAINKATKGGWTHDVYYDGGYPYYMIWQHDFAKALWGETKPLENGEYPPQVIMYKGEPMWHPWKHHLREMVVADDPIEYLGENI